MELSRYSVQLFFLCDSQRFEFLVQLAIERSPFALKLMFSARSESAEGLEQGGEAADPAK